MVYEILPFRYDIGLLQEHLRSEVLPLKMVYQGKNFGGWSVTSSNGDYRDGWGRDHEKYTHVEPRNLEDVKKVDAGRGISDIKDFKHPTQICTGYIKDVVDDLGARGFFPRRVRISMLEPHASVLWHRDAPDWLYSMRLHIPILTNAGCFFEVEGERAHLPADGSIYAVRVNRMHRVVNDGDEPRYHLIMNAWDTKGTTRHHQFTEEDRKRIGL